VGKGKLHHSAVAAAEVPPTGVAARYRQSPGRGHGTATHPRHGAQPGTERRVAQAFTEKQRVAGAVAAAHLGYFHVRAIVEAADKEIVTGDADDATEASHTDIVGPAQRLAPLADQEEEAQDFPIRGTGSEGIQKRRHA